MNYFDCHADTLTEIVKPGDCLEENSGDLELKRAGDFVENGESAQTVKSSRIFIY